MKDKLIEKYAGLALQGIMANPTYYNHTPESIADHAYKAAAVLIGKLKNEENRYFREIGKEISQLKRDTYGAHIFDKYISFLKCISNFENQTVCLKVKIQQVLSEEVFAVFDDDEKRICLNLGYVSREKVLENLDKTVYVYATLEFGELSVTRIGGIPAQEDTHEEVTTIRDGSNFVDDEYHGKVIRFVGKVIPTRKNSITVELIDKVGSLFDVYLDKTPAPTETNSYDLYYVYVIVNTKTSGWKYRFHSIEPYVKIPDGQLTVESAIELIEQGKTGEVITLEAENVFYQNRDSAGDRRAAWKALEYSLLAHGIQKQEVEDRTSSNQIESISQLIVDYIFAKYS